MYSNSNNSTDIDYDYLFYIATVVLKMTEEEFWNCSPRKLFALISIHNKINSTNSSNLNNRSKDRVEYL